MENTDGFSCTRTHGLFRFGDYIVDGQFSFVFLVLLDILYKANVIETPVVLYYTLVKRV